MTLDQLRIFIAVAEREHVTRAADDVHLTQSAASAAVAALEARYSVKLFDRVGRRVRLTEAGRLFLAEARALVARAETAESLLVDLAGLKRGTLSVAASQTVAGYWLPAVMHRYRQRYPGIGTRLAIGNSETVADWVGSGVATVGVVEGAIDGRLLHVEPVAEDELVLVVGRDHPWSARPRVDPAALAETPWVVREPGSGTRSIMEAVLRGLGVAPAALERAMELPSNESVRAAVEAGAGATIISRLVAASGLRSGSLAEIELPLPKRPFVAIRHRERHVTKALAAFLDLVRPAGSEAET